MLKGERFALELPPLLCSLLAGAVDDQVRLTVELATKVEAARLARQAQLQVEVLRRGILDAAAPVLFLAKLAHVIVDELVVRGVVVRPHAKVLMLREEVEALRHVACELQDHECWVVQPLLRRAREVTRTMVHEAKVLHVLHAQPLANPAPAQVHHVLFVQLDLLAEAVWMLARWVDVALL